jgi:MFS transporter, SET family, sugar efflux transporter
MEAKSSEFDSKNLIMRIFSEKGLLVASTGIFLSGAAMAATQPYLTIIAINELHLQPYTYSLLFIFGSICHVALSIAFGMIADKYSVRSKLIALATAVGIVGYGLFYLSPNAPWFIVCITFLIPIASTSYSQFFAVARTLTSGRDRNFSSKLNSLLRASVSASWVLTTFATSLLLSDGRPASGTFILAAIFYVGAFMAAFMWRWKSAGTAGITGSQKWTSSREDLATWEVIGSVLCVGLLEGSIKLNSMLLGPLVTSSDLGRSSDVAAIYTLLALLEIPFIIMWGALLGRFKSHKILFLGGIVYSIYFFLLSSATSMNYIFSITLVNALGCSAVISISISYLQDLIKSRPGLGSSLLSVTSFLGSAVSSLAFSAIGSTIGMSGIAIVGSLLAAAGGLGLLFAGRRSTA